MLENVHIQSENAETDEANLVKSAVELEIGKGFLGIMVWAN
jgi:hypothetical protein